MQRQCTREAQRKLLPKNKLAAIANITGGPNTARLPRAPSRTNGGTTQTQVNAIKHKIAAFISSFCCLVLAITASTLMRCDGYHKTFIC